MKVILATEEISEILNNYKHLSYVTFREWYEDNYGIVLGDHLVGHPIETLPAHTEVMLEHKLAQGIESGRKRNATNAENRAKWDAILYIGKSPHTKNYFPLFTENDLLEINCRFKETKPLDLVSWVSNYFGGTFSGFDPTSGAQGLIDYVVDTIVEHRHVYEIHSSYYTRRKEEPLDLVECLYDVQMQNKFPELNIPYVKECLDFPRLPKLLYLEIEQATKLISIMSDIGQKEEQVTDIVPDHLAQQCLNAVQLAAHKVGELDKLANEYTAIGLVYLLGEDAILKYLSNLQSTRMLTWLRKNHLYIEDSDIPAKSGARASTTSAFASI